MALRTKTTWWGTVLDAPDPRELGRFYERLLGWTSEVSLEEGLRRTIEWFSGAVDRYKPQLYNV